MRPGEEKKASLFFLPLSVSQTEKRESILTILPRSGASDKKKTAQDPKRGTDLNRRPHSLIVSLSFSHSLRKVLLRREKEEGIVLSRPSDQTLSLQGPQELIHA